MNRIPSAPRALSTAVVAAARRAIERVVREAVPALADFSLVHVVAGRGIACVAGAHSSRGGARAMRALMRVHRIRRDDRASTVAQVVRTRRATLRREIHPEVPARDRTSAVAELHRRLAPSSVLVVPIVHGNRILGALSLCYSHSGRAYAARHVAAADRIASRIARHLVPEAPLDDPLSPRTAVRPLVPAASGRRRVPVSH